MTNLVLEKLKIGRSQIANPEDWRRGPHDDPNALADARPYCAGSALWISGGDEADRSAESEAVRRLLAAAGVVLPEPRDEDDEIGALVAWNDSSDHATVLAAYDRAISEFVS